MGGGMVVGWGWVVETVDGGMGVVGWRWVVKLNFMDRYGKLNIFLSSNCCGVGGGGVDGGCGVDG